ncbi:MAG TPA: protealysin inhibitor emfourin [Anaerolineales bacterium]|nr:protealysin inhibitor emfourin [Anaerolineales bacterium]
MINFRRTGGAIGREITFDVDMDSLPGSAAQRLDGLLTAADFFEIPTVNNLMARPDEYEYTVTVIAGNSMHTVHVSDTNMPESLQPLVRELTELAKAAT